MVGLYTLFFLFIFAYFCSFSIQQIDSKEIFSYAQEKIFNNNVVSISKGAANPEVDITNLSPRQWYDPTVISINVNDTVTWVNNDTEPHTVTSGLGGGLNSLISNSQGKPNGLFDSGLFSAGDSISIRFNTSGTFSYFCTIHPWMEGTVVVRNTSTSIPSYPVDQVGNKIDEFPIYNFTEDNRIEIGLSWTPVTIMTNEPITFIMDFFEYPENSRLHLWPYNFVILQNGSEIYRTSDITQVGSSSRTYAFNSSGEVTIRIESTDNKNTFVEFGTIVYENPYESSADFENVSNNTFSLLSPLTLVYIVYGIIIILPITLVIIIILYKKKKI
ncbi:cupredoxin domain-containing protein [Candidatus Nitrosocosmicus franklandus]|uniref:Plastocyanin n=1 Tax=Candidatus Nitrosocosmicus franklandianus TaxID=1798806 RepID=A0A484IJU3_9ARCH|nr:plastocyanin/azurin family copper-binding protein [Candidatus Nitrosocosmicus franklandus]VFJ15159.1 Plastocyanin [Candidatus Nitrosocosmicus franklandus]